MANTTALPDAKKVRADLAAIDEKIDEKMDERELFIAQLKEIDKSYEELLAERQKNPLAHRHPRQDTLTPIPTPTPQATQPDPAPQATVDVAPPQAPTTVDTTTPVVPVVATEPATSRIAKIRNSARGLSQATTWTIIGISAGILVMLAITGIFGLIAEVAGWTYYGWLIFIYVVLWLIATGAGGFLGYSHGVTKDAAAPNNHA